MHFFVIDWVLFDLRDVVCVLMLLWVLFGFGFLVLVWVCWGLLLGDVLLFCDLLVSYVVCLVGLFVLSFVGRFGLRVYFVMLGLGICCVD